MNYRKKKISILIATFIVIILILSTYFYYFEPRTWGDKGELSILISADKTKIEINQTINLTLTYANTGDKDLRILPMFGEKILILNSSNGSVKYVGPLRTRPSYTNKNLITLKAHKSKSYILDISKYDWDIKQNETYRVIAHYRIHDKEDITLPFWTQELWSNEVYFQIIR